METNDRNTMHNKVEQCTLHSLIYCYSISGSTQVEHESIPSISILIQIHCLLADRCLCAEDIGQDGKEF